MRRLLVLSMHTSPLVQPGTGDGGGMNVYVRELTSSLARNGIACDVYTRRDSSLLPAVVSVEPGLRVHHVNAGPARPVPKQQLHQYVGSFVGGVLGCLAADELAGEVAPDAIHANYWLSGIAGHALKHQLGLPLVSTFHTLDRVKAEASPEDVDPVDPDRRARAEAEVIGCSDAVLASCRVELEQLVDLYGADPERVEIVPLGVDRAFFSPGNRAQARRAVALDEGGPLLLFVGRIQPLKGADLTLRALAALPRLGIPDARLVLVGGPSGPHGELEEARLHDLVAALGLGGRVRFLPPQPHDLLTTYYRAADVCLIPSRSESFGLVALEAAACGTPVVASAVGGLTTIVDHGRTGMVVAHGDAEAFATEVAKICGNPVLAREMGSAAAEDAAAYTWPAAAARLRLVFAAITARSLVDCS